MAYEDIIDPFDSPPIMKSIGQTESSGNYGATNRLSGAKGKYQIMPENWKSWAGEAGIGANAPMTPQNQETVTQYKLQQYEKRYKGDDQLVAAAWYAGDGYAQSMQRNKPLYDIDRPQKGGHPSVNDYIKKTTGAKWVPVVDPFADIVDPFDKKKSQDVTTPEDRVPEWGREHPNIYAATEVIGGPVEAGLSALSGAVGGLAGLGASIATAPFKGDEYAKGLREYTSDMYTYKPYTETGQNMAQALGTVAQNTIGLPRKATEAMGLGEQWGNLADVATMGLLPKAKLSNIPKAIEAGKTGWYNARAKLEGIANLEKERNAVINEGINQGIRPSYQGKKTTAKYRAYNQHANDAVIDIIREKNQHSFERNGQVVTGQLPQTPEEFAQVLDSSIKREVEGRSKVASLPENKGILIDSEKNVSGLDEIISNHDKGPDAQAAAQKIRDWISPKDAEGKPTIPKRTISQTLDLITNLNQEARKWYRSGHPDAASLGYMAEKVARSLREDVAASLESGGPEWRQSGRKIRNYMALEGDVNARARVFARANPVGLHGALSNVYSAAHAARSVLSGSGADAGMAAASIAAKLYNKHMNSPSTIINNMFNKADRLTRVIDKWTPKKTSVGPAPKGSPLLTHDPRYPAMNMGMSDTSGVKGVPGEYPDKVTPKHMSPDVLADQTSGGAEYPHETRTDIYSAIDPRKVQGADLTDLIRTHAGATPINPVSAGAIEAKMPKPSGKLAADSATTFTNMKHQSEFIQNSVATFKKAILNVLGKSAEAGLTKDDVFKVWNHIEGDPSVNKDLELFIKTLSNDAKSSLIKKVNKGEIPPELQQFAKKGLRIFNVAPGDEGTIDPTELWEGSRPKPPIGGVIPRAFGGPVQPGQPYLVGEKGPETMLTPQGIVSIGVDGPQVIQPKQPGMVLPSLAQKSKVNFEQMQSLADKWGGRFLKPKDMLNTAVRVNGNIETAPAGNTHASILKGRDGTRGFQTPDGHFVNRKTASEIVKQTQPQVYEKLDAANKAHLHSEGYRDAVKAVPKVIDEETAIKYLNKHDGDAAKARAAAIKDGYIIQPEVKDNVI